MRIEQFATDLGDLLCVTAMAAVVGFWCWQQLDRLAAAAFAATYAAALCLTTGLKMVSAAFAAPPHEASLLSPRPRGFWWLGRA